MESYCRLILMLISMGLFAACKKEQQSKPVPVSYWSFQTHEHFYAGKIFWAKFKDSAGKGNLLLKGRTGGIMPDSGFELSLRFPGPTLDPGAYLTSDADFGNYFIFRKADDGEIIFYAGEVASPPSIGIEINSYNPETRLVTGSFEGYVNNYTLVYPIYETRITGGHFEAVIR